MDHSRSPSRSSVAGHELAAGPKPLTHRELASGALYNAAQPHRHERRPAQTLSEEQMLRMESHYSVADISAGHLFNPTSSFHEVDPPTWPAHGMENVPPGKSPFRTYRLERPPSPPATKTHTTVYQGRRPSHRTVASGALYNPYVQTRLPDDLQPPEEFKVLRRSTTGNSSRLYAPSPRAPLRIPVARDQSEGSVSKNGSVQGENVYIFPGDNPRSSVHFASGGLLDQPSVRSHRSSLSQRGQGASGSPAPALGTASNAPSRARTISDDTMYYHPSREGSVRMATLPEHEPSIQAAPGSAHFSNIPSHSPTAGGGSMHTVRSHSPSTVLAHPAPWMQQEAIDSGAFASMHPSRANSPGSFIQHSRAASARGPSSLHHTTSVHLSRTPSSVGMHPSQVPTVIRDHDEFAVHPDDVHHGEAWGGGGQTWGQGQDDAWGSGAPVERSPSRASTVNGGGGQAWGHGQDDAWGAGVERPASSASTIKGGAGSSRSAHPSRAPSAAGSHISRLQDQSGNLLPPHIPSRAPSAAPSQSSHFQAQNEIPARAASVAPSLVSRFQEQNGGATPRIPGRALSATSIRAMSPTLVGSLTRADSPSFMLPAQFDRLTEEDDTPSWAPQGEPQPEIVRAMSPGAVSMSGGHAPSIHAPGGPLSAHPSRAPSAAPNDAASIWSRAPSAIGEAAHIPSRAPSAMGVPSRAPSAAPTLTRRGKTSRLGRGGGRATPAMAGSDQENIRISVVQPNE